MPTAALKEESLPRTVLTRAQLAERIAQGEVLVLHRRLIYKLDRWIKVHPGGDVAILHFVGRDAKDEIEVYHCDETIRKMRRFCIAQLAEEDATDVSKGRVYRPLMPPIQLGYRNGVLEHPDAQRDAWREQKGAGERPTKFPLPVSLLEPPPTTVDPLEQARLSLAFEDLHQRIKDAGMYTLHPLNYGRECVRYVSGVLISAYLYHVARGLSGAPSVIAFLASAVALGLVGQQLTFVAHDAAHAGITHIHAVDRAIGIGIAAFLGGLSLLWWCDNHDVHHLVTNHPEHDPDIQHMPIFAISEAFVWNSRVDAGHSVSTEANRDALNRPSGIWSSYYRRLISFDTPARFLLRMQHRLYYFFMSLGRFNLYALSYGFLLTKAKATRWLLLEVVGLVFFWTWYGWYVLGSIPDWRVRIAYLLVSHIATSPVHVQIVLSHFAQDTSDLGPAECFASRQIRTTMDVACPKYIEFIHGGLHMQVSHHLFPRLPRHNLRETRDRFVRPFCKENGLVYDEMTFLPGNGKVLSRLREVGNQVSVLMCVAEAQAKGKLH
ncbi:sphingolipid 8-(E)-desaturase [Malassezia cuniculi]|uniref:Delta 8-(E)-sphingolipid desaturase n=1 Tax=Malassezia cuniculi TaxID=948313 RepID=A0AAF0EWW6_9BASI|nr:sphingolipid 8-(E)-desaturase [Malassezia cuniculi]